MKRKILIVGSINVDLIIQTPSIPMPGQNIYGKDFCILPGGKGANQALSVARLAKNCTSSIAGKVGYDYFGRMLLKNLKDNKVSVKYVNKDLEKFTGVALIMITPDGENRIIAATGANGNFSIESARKLDKVIAIADLILLQLELPLDSIKEIIKIANRLGKIIILDAGPPPDTELDPIFFNTTILTPNKEEAEVLSKRNIRSKKDAFEVARYFINKGVKNVVIKLGEDGAILAKSNMEKYFPAYDVKPVDTTGAGDAFSAALAVSIIENKNIEYAVNFANAAGALTVTKLGAQSAVPTRIELENFIRRYSYKIKN
jgi:ribokinase